TVGTGRIERGSCKVGDEVEILGLRKDSSKTVITGIEMFQKTLEKGQAGDNVGVLLRGIERDGLERGQVLAKPGSINPHTKFECSIYVLSKEELINRLNNVFNDESINSLSFFQKVALTAVKKQIISKINAGKIQTRADLKAALQNP
ncbi:MAG: hypothetical protein EBY07_09290, partial [Actinobacteria bacterium]|nr:hypothetical protein [Actinomycetota bacterium]